MSSRNVRAQWFPRASVRGTTIASKRFVSSPSFSLTARSSHPRRDKKFNIEPKSCGVEWRGERGRMQLLLSGIAKWRGFHWLPVEVRQLNQREVPWIRELRENFPSRSGKTYTNPEMETPVPLFPVVDGVSPTDLVSFRVYLFL